MGGLRNILLRHRTLAALLLAAALCMKLLVPSGFMLGQQGRMLTVEICTGLPDQHQTVTIPLGAGNQPADGKGSAGKAQEACPYASLAMGALGGADGLLLALAFAFILALGLAPRRDLPARRGAQLRPPLRGPPVFA